MAVSPSNNNYVSTASYPHRQRQTSRMIQQANGEEHGNSVSPSSSSGGDGVKRLSEQKHRVNATRRAAEKAVFEEDQPRRSASLTKTASTESSPVSPSANEEGAINKSTPHRRRHSSHSQTRSPRRHQRSTPPDKPRVARLGDFDVLGTLGTGTFGRVLLVRPNRNLLLQLRHPRRHRGGPLSDERDMLRNDGDGELFALKALDKEAVVKMKQVEHANSERDILSRISHPFVVNLRSTFQDSRCIYLLMEFAMGGEIFSYLRRAKRFPVEVTKFYIASLILVLEHLHSRNIVYRDLKPENLLLDAEGHVKVTDFGFAKELVDGERTFTLCGTPEFLAPEVVRGVGHGKAADWWALGILMYEMLCGFPPFWDETPLGTYSKILAGEFHFPHHVDVVCRDLIRSLLTVDLSRRLGNLANGSADVKRHFFFHRVNWQALESKTVQPPIVPARPQASRPQGLEAPADRNASLGSGGNASTPDAASSGTSQHNNLLANFAKYPPPEPESLPGLLGSEAPPSSPGGYGGPHDAFFTSF